MGSNAGSAFAFEVVESVRRARKEVLAEAVEGDRRVDARAS